MPFRSQAQWKWAFATNQDFARKWARETPGGKRRFARLSKKIGMKAAVDEYMTTFKEREYVRDDSGKFAEKPGGGLDKAAAAQRMVDKLAKPKKGGGKGSAKPKKTEAQRNAERATEARDNAMSVLDKVGFDASDYELLSDRGAQDANDPSVQRLIDKGLMERVGDKVYTSALGKKITAAAERGDADGAQETLDRDAAKRQEREAKRQEREAKRAEAEAKRQAAEEEKKKKPKGGGGGGKKPKEPDTTAQRKRFDTAIARLSQRLERERDGTRALALQAQIDKLTTQRDKLGKTTKADGHIPPQGVRDAAKRGLELRSQFGRGGTPVGIARARDLSNGTRVSDSTIKRMVSFFARHAVDKRPGWGDPANPTNGYIAHMLWGGDAGKAWAGKIARQLDASTKELNCSMVEDDDMSIPDGLIQRVKSLTYKHGKHDQKSHGRKTARRAAYQAAYSAAKAEGKSPVEARDAAKAASRVELEKRIAERRAEVAQRAAERAAKRGVIPKVDERKVELPPEPLGPPPVVVQPQVVTTPEETFRPRKSSSPSVRSGGRGQRISGTKLEQELERVNYWIDKARRLGQTDRVDALIKERDGLRTEITKRREAAQARSAKRVEDARDSWYRRQMAQANLRQKQSGDGFMVYKSSDGYRWVAISSTAYLDRDKEIVSTKALKQAVERAEATGEYGPLRFWHVPGIDIGTTDYQALSNDGKFLVESGVITDEAIAQSLMKRGKGWQVSIGFEHPRLEPVNGVFENIRIFERSITPPGRAANPMTGFSMVEENKS